MRTIIFLSICYLLSVPKSFSQQQRPGNPGRLQQDSLALAEGFSRIMQVKSQAEIDSASARAKQLYATAEKNGLGLLAGRIAYQLVSEFYQQGKYEAAMQTIYIAIMAGETYNDKQLLAQAYDMTGKTYTAKMNLEMNRKVRWIWIAGVLMVASVVLLIIVYIRGRQKLKLERQYRAVLKKEKEAQVMESVMLGEEKERLRIARELHDGIAGTLAAVKMHFNRVGVEENLMHSATFRQGMNLMDEVYKDVRQTSHNLMPEILVRCGLDEALCRYCNSINHQQTLRIQYFVVGKIPRIKPSYELSIYRIVQELILNIIKHAQASEATVQISYYNNTLSITVEDNGVGFNPNLIPAQGFGLESLRERVRSMQGLFDIQAIPGAGVNAYLELQTEDLVLK